MVSRRAPLSFCRPGGLTGAARAGGRVAVLVGGLASAAVASLGAGCTASSEEVRPPRDAFFFPTGLAVDAAQRTLFVANANSELRYDSGTISAVDLQLVDDISNAWVASGTVPAGCHPDLERAETLVCEEAMFITGAARIGNFATSLAVQDLQNGNSRIIVPVRGDPSITWADWNGSTMSCEDGGGSYPQCDDDHRLTTIRNDETYGTILEEPFRVTVDSGKEVALVTHLTSGTVTLVSSPRDGTPIVADDMGGLFLAGTQSLVPGSSGVAARKPTRVGMPVDELEEQLFYVAARTEDRVQMLTVEKPENDLPRLVQSNYFFLDGAGTNIGQSGDSRGLAFTASGNSMLVINRRPPTLQIYDTSLDATGLPRNEVAAVYDICREASGLVVGDAGAGELALVSCFREGTMYITDATGRRPTDAIVTVGRGPTDVAMSATRKKAYVTNFLEDTVGVIDLAPGSKRQYREVLRIGETRL